jgi:opacity protein-like surface antigen
MRKFIILFLILASYTLSLAGDASRKGTSGAEQLLIPVGARSIATGGAFVSNVVGLEALYYNPGGLDLMNGTEAMFNYMNYVADINMSYFAVGTTLDIGSFALSYKSLDFGDIPVTTFDSPDGTGQNYSPSFFVLGLSYSKALTDRVSAGVNFKLINESIMNTTASGIAVDFGVQYRFRQNFSLGAVVKNIGTNMSYSGEDLKVKTPVPNSSLTSGSGVYEADTESFQIPSYFELSLAYELSFDDYNGVLLGTTFRNNNTLEDAMQVGMEYRFQDLFFLRGGYNYQLENTSESIYSYTLGAGINYEMVDGITVEFDYAFRNVDEFLNDNHVFTVILGLR